MTNKNYLKSVFFLFQLPYLMGGGGGGEKSIAPQMGSCDEISRIWSFKKTCKNKKWKVSIALQTIKFSWTLSKKNKP
jgi:hypothetical protein